MDSLVFDGPEQIPIKLPTSIFLPGRSYLGWKIVITLFHLMSGSSTIYRLVHRYRIRRLWWDDYILLGALVLDFVYWPIYWARATRAATALAFARIFPPRHAARRWAFTLVIFMVLTGLATLLFTTLTCKAASALLVAAEMTHCMVVFKYVHLKHVLFFLADLVCDSLLIITPLVVFWRIKLPPTKRRLILIFFCGNVLTLLGAILYLAIGSTKTVFALGPDRPLVNLGLGAVNVSMGFMSCNMMVLSTCFYRALNRYRNRQRTAVVQNPNSNPVAPVPEPPVAECNCMTSDHITPLSLTEISTTYTTWRSNSSHSRRDTDPHDMLDSFHPSDVADSTTGSSARKSAASSWSFPTNSSKSQKSKLSGSNLEDSEEFDLTSFESPSYESDSVKEQSSSAGSSEEWSTRAAMALSLARIFPPRHAARRWAFTLVVFMVFATLATLLFTTLTCKATSPLLVPAEMTNCITIYKYVPLKHILFFLVYSPPFHVADLVCDGLLIITPLVIFWRIKLPPTERRLILTFFCGSILTLLGSTAYLIIVNRRSVFALGPDRPLVNIAIGAVEVSMGFMACNLVVLSTCFYQAYRKFRSRKRTPVVLNRNPNPVAPAQEPPVSECTCMTSDHITPLSLTEISTAYTQPSNSRSNRSRRDTYLQDMLDSFHPSDMQDSVAGSDARKSSASAWSFPTTGSAKSQKSKMSASDLEDSGELDFTSIESPSYESNSVNAQTSSAGPSEDQSSSTVSSKEQFSSTTSSKERSSNRNSSRGRSRSPTSSKELSSSESVSHSSSSAS
ncbi:hypothetical protein CVT25_013417 [Psilocybe cyanescens]|uniref:Uncharacterized protein n=1 Tax=Psilocybe cyanescens TaxID=93625 RepID=A0A409WSS2_PSICY|nr:hypothetical protein CVT25_013417 [Psilocybe cyanescens]